MPSIQDAEFDHLINGAIKCSIVSFAKLAGFASNKSCLPAQYKRTLAVMYWHLSANKIPRDRVRIISGEFEIPFLCLTSLGLTLPVWLSCSEIYTSLVQGLIKHWHDIREWLLWLHTQVITRQDVDINLRTSSKLAVLEFLGLVRDRLLMDWSRRIPTDKAVVKMIGELWFLEARDSRFHSWSSTGARQRESAVFNSCFLIAQETGTNINWDDILRIFDSSTDVIATTTIGHLEREMKQKTVDISCIGWDVHIISVISLQDNICPSLIRHGAIRVVTSVLPLIVSKHTSEEERSMAARCVVNVTAFLKLRLEDLDGIPLMIEAIESGLIPSLVKCEPLLPFVDHPAAREQPISLLGNLLVNYTMYRSVLRPVMLSMDVVESSRMELNLVKGSQLHRAWMRLKEVVAERRRLMKHDIADGYHIQTCQNEKCGRAGEIGAFKRCGGCLHAFYCSKACQRDDWEDGQHKVYCNGIHRRYLRTDGQMTNLRQKDIEFLDQVIIAEVKKHITRIRAHNLKINVMELNFVNGDVDTIFDSRRVSHTPFGIDCPCEKFAHERWNKIIEKAKGAQEPLVLVRAHIPGGLARKILLRALPLRCVLDEVSRTYHRENENRLSFPNHLSLMYTCCGQNATKKGTVGIRG